MLNLEAEKWKKLERKTFLILRSCPCKHLSVFPFHRFFYYVCVLGHILNLNCIDTLTNIYAHYCKWSKPFLRGSFA